MLRVHDCMQFLISAFCQKNLGFTYKIELAVTSVLVVTILVETVFVQRGCPLKIFPIGVKFVPFRDGC